MRPLIALLLALAVAFSGCASDSKDEQDPGTGDGGSVVNNTTVGPKVFTGTGTVVASAGTSQTGGGGFSQGGLEFAVEVGATLLFAEIEWDDPVQDLDMGLASPESGSAAGERNWDHTASGGMPGAPDSPHSLTIPSPLAGDWFGGALANGASGNLPYRIVVTVFHGETSVPEGYSAL